MSTSQSGRQLFPPNEQPYEPNVGGTGPNTIYPSDADFPTTAGEPGFLMGTCHLELPGVHGSLLETDVLYRMPLMDNDFQDGILTGDLQEVPDTMPDFFWEPTEYYPILAPVLVTNRLVTAHYRDFAQKHPTLKRPYRTTLIVEYVEAHPAIDALEPALRDRIYADLRQSDYAVLVVDPAKYQADSTYSAADDVRRRYNRQFNPTGAWHPTPESVKINQIDPTKL